MKVVQRGREKSQAEKTAQVLRPEQAQLAQGTARKPKMGSEEWLAPYPPRKLNFRNHATHRNILEHISRGSTVLKCQGALFLTHKLPPESIPES